MAGMVHVIDHPLVQHKLTLMRSRDTSTSSFRNLLREISMLLAYEVCRDLPTTQVEIHTPLAPMMATNSPGRMWKSRETTTVTRPRPTARERARSIS